MISSITFTTMGFWQIGEILVPFVWPRFPFTISLPMYLRYKKRLGHSEARNRFKLPSLEFEPMNDTISLRIALRYPMMGVLLLLCCPWSWTELNAQITRYTLSGYVRDAAGKEALAGASLWVPEIQNGTSSNAYGFYSITLPSGTYRLQVSYVGYQTQTVQINLDRNQSMDFALAAANDLREIEIIDDRVRRQAQEIQMSKVELTPQQIQQIPMLFGEKDLLKTFQLMPGVQKGNEGSAGLYVRGGGPDQNLILLDEATVYNASHLFGFFSVFNGNAIKNASLTKGGFPARYGGRLSSVLDIRMKDGNMDHWCAEGSVG
ncbi:MAG: hypothetical protein FJ351_07045, partial [Sphingomonadales bacterium]|nr:hypothetical protein [Sphingomonadales bacterium]